MQIEISTFLNSNWQSVIVALIVGSLFHVLSTYAQRRYVTSAERVKIKQAKASLMDILEARIINKQDIPLDKIDHLLEAVERDHSVFLADVTSISLLQDLELQFEKSHHLDPTQKEEYCKQIQNKIREIETTEEESLIPKKYSEIFDTLVEEITSKNTNEALKSLELLKKRISEREEYISEDGNNIFRQLINIIITISLIYAVIKLLNLYSISIIWILGGIIVIIILAAIIGAFIFGMGDPSER